LCCDQTVDRNSADQTKGRTCGQTNSQTIKDVRKADIKSKRQTVRQIETEKIVTQTYRWVNIQTIKLTHRQDIKQKVRPTGGATKRLSYRHIKTEIHRDKVQIDR
jgi:hypothetical protein